VPTFFLTERFLRNLEELTPEQRQAFRAAVEKFRDDLANRRFRRGLRIKRVQGTSDIFELTWAPDGRATFQFGAEVVESEPHVIWRRVGTHDILSNP
jgi:hypothetical protein